MDLVAKRAGVGKATIYRRWASKEELVLDAMSVAPPVIQLPDTGTLRDDLVAYATALARKFGAAPASDILPHLIEAACYDERLRTSLHEYARHRQQTLRTILQRASERGELTAGDDAEIIIDLLMGAFHYRRLITGDPFTPRFAVRLVDSILNRVGEA
jgi:AcrR family transcriptional regulator